MPRENVDARNDGLVIVLYGGRSGFTTRRAGVTVARAYYRFSQTLVGGTNEPGDRFGRTLAIGDIDGDGANDLVVGAPGEESRGEADAGMVGIIYGQPGGPSATSRTQRPGQALLGAEEAGDSFGASLCVGDTDGDGRDDLFVGAPNEDRLGVDDTGAVYPLSERPFLIP